MIAGPGPGCSISRGDNIWSSCVVRVLICVLHKKKKSSFYTLFLWRFCKLWFSFGSILSRSSTRLPLLANAWLVHTPTFVFPLQSESLFFFPFIQSMPVGMLQSYILRSPSTVPHIFMLPQQSPRGVTEVQLEGSIAAPPFWNRTPILFPTLLQSYLCIRIFQYPHALLLQDSQLLANGICCFDIKAYSPKLLSNNERGKPSL